MCSTDEIKSILGAFNPILPDEMKRIKLMNRIDLKYIIPTSIVSGLLQNLFKQYKVLEINGKRQFSYSTSYLDTPGFGLFYRHITGRPERCTIRYRIHNETGTSFLEVKQRTNRARTIKWRIKNELSDFTPDLNALSFITSCISEDASLLSPVLTGNFNRITLADITANERVNIDFDLHFSDLNGHSCSFPYLSVVELKKETFACRSFISEILKAMHYKPTGFSRYCIGIAAIYNPSGINALKPKLLMLKKIENENYRSIAV